jgi:putative addiction module CopG family antidote
MDTVRTLSITLPEDLARQVQTLVASGAYASESEAVEEGLRTLLAREDEVERWLRDEVVPTAEAYFADPSRGVPIDEAFADLEENYLMRKNTTK